MLPLWISPSSNGACVQGERIFFSSDAKLPQDTSGPIAKLRQKELYAIQASGTEQRKSPDRIYDYQAYNDLGNPVKSPDLERPTLGGTAFPFPRRLRTGRPLVPGTEYEVAPPKQLCAPKIIKARQHTRTALKCSDRHLLRALKWGKTGMETSTISNVDCSVTKTACRPKACALTPSSCVTSRPRQASKFKLPRVRRNRQLVWCSDEEFGRQYLAGQHPCFIQAVTPKWLHEETLFTDESIGGGSQYSLITGLLEGKTLTERLEEGGRLYRADYTAGFADYIERINAQKIPEGATNVSWLTKDRTQHAGKALFYYTDNGYMLPVAIELQKKLGQEGTVYTPYDVKELWQLAKEIISSLDCGYHQLVSHYLRAHACQEPFIIATMRHLSALHPVYKLMLPHFRYTMHINANARSILINADGTLEQTFTSGRYTMELASYVYKNLYRFDQQDFEADLILRWNPVRDSAERLVPALDYPYAQDGLDIWYAMRDWFGAYLQLYYASDVKLKEDVEIQSWWTEIQAEGHPDKTEGWPALDTVTDLRDILTTIAFTGSAHHAAVNFGQYDYSGYMPNRPALIRKPIPEKGGAGVKELKESYESELLSYLPNPEDSLAAALLYVVLSSHAPNEEYLDHKIPQWIDDRNARAAHENFLTALAKLDEDISARNRSGSKIRGVVGTRGLPYELLRPNSKAGVTSRGVPCSTSI
ncbi:Lipoxigenase [Coccomyxa subellipsoidea C-169]|uniref:Lipoxygenase n=1 Tax=Coccomyxa subellipsoidea (strain C-169) TaxID=574566 RepID=I0YJS7_COCSC|nr:Lipoxigenase [Coccomyxa subellipsoidea C-169]EIE18646.1 Lipoxigenase [Coccomyxa subellipsoidea C-169]|eukprot:XP_005643190.1 Lipoxigenase [Coccomyxa subellipsoidea C-169]